jgi:hypothetical protein
MNPLLTDLSALTDLPLWLIAVVVIWSLTWKGLALWKAAKRNSPNWFVVLLVVNTLGIFEMLYLYIFSEMKFDQKATGKKPLSKKRLRLVKQRKSFLDE